MVDPSLLRLAADRGVTICFADLDGADGLWVPEERTVLVNRRLSEREVAEVIEHELGHAAIDDQHADLDAGIGRPSPPSSRRWTAALTAAACLAVFGGLSAGLARDPGTDDKGPVVAPSAPPLTAAPPGPEVTTARVGGPDGQPQVRTVTVTGSATATTPAATTAGSVAPTRTGASPEPAPPPSPTTPVATTPPVETDPSTTEPAPTTPPPTTAPADDPADDTEDVLEDEVGKTAGTGTQTVTSAPAGTP